jgi:hypothetical protein
MVLSGPHRRLDARRTDTRALLLAPGDRDGRSLASRGRRAGLPASKWLSAACGLVRWALLHSDLYRPTASRHRSGAAASDHRAANRRGSARGLSRRMVRAERSASDTIRRSEFGGWSQPHWRPAGDDSLDIRYVGWPLGLRLRMPVPALETEVSGRALVNGDVGGEWFRLDVVRASQVQCAGLSFHESKWTLP